MYQLNIPINGYLMMKDLKVAKITNDRLEILNKDLLPGYFLAHDLNIDGWLKNRCFDSSRTNVRLIKRILNIRKCPSKEIAIRFHAISITDKYWIKISNEDYKSVSSLSDRLSKSALFGKVIEDFEGITPEVTNLGSFEKCWIKDRDTWNLLKLADDKRLFSEIFVYKLGELLNLPMARYFYCKENDCIETTNFTNEDVFLDEMKNYLNDCEDFECNISFLKTLPNHQDLIKQYCDILFMDVLCYNFDRHTGNYGFLRSCIDGRILSMAPNYDNNNALISREYLKSCKTPEMIIKMFLDEIRGTNYKIPKVDLSEVNNLVDLVVNDLKEFRPSVEKSVDKSYVKNFIKNNYLDLIGGVTL